MQDQTRLRTVWQPMKRVRLVPARIVSDIHSQHLSRVVGKRGKEDVRPTKTIGFLFLFAHQSGT